MKLSKKHLGMAFDVAGGDGSWFYVLIAVRKDGCLFRGSDGKDYFDMDIKDEWRIYKPHKWCLSFTSTKEAINSAIKIKDGSFLNED